MGMNIKNILIAVSVVALVLGGVAFLTDGKTSGVYDTFTTSELKAITHGVIQYFDTENKVIEPTVQVELENLNPDLDLVALVKYIANGTPKEVDLAPNERTSFIAKLDQLDLNNKGVFTRDVEFYVNSQSNLVGKHTVYLVVGVCPKIEAQVDNTTKLIAPQFVIADNNPDYLVLFFDVNDTKTVSAINITTTLPITVSSITWTEQQLNDNTYLRILVRYEPSQSVVEDKIYKDNSITVEISYDDGTSEQATVNGVIFAKTTKVEKLAEKCDKAFENIANVG
jgi:hypothetical protein